MKIGKLAQVVGCTVETVRFYEKQGLLPPPQRTSGNFRLYNDEHLERLTFICYCRSLDISLHEIKQLLELKNAPAAKDEMSELLDRHIRDVVKRIHELDHLRLQLIALKGKVNNAAQEADLMNTLLQHGKVRFVGVK
ncbi:Cd(II)/Pb(II)-responsive transcriptional regulator [Bisgaard Taxon 10/6]|uniref:Cd(II)/Pb(II)-responsive transcriptional regulator n=1 Tax=Exercitatus varius TaxID=67857 RepID=A0ABT6ER18_9PAST|nr:Cd(II)/Pb(II)-responsive transcriptional regulator [Exercitatus varius]MDG2945436.1 Cd(II)/Pb(II)-responsive transcriptional regulator [Exercitatus varius]